MIKYFIVLINIFIAYNAIGQIELYEKYHVNNLHDTLYYKRYRKDILDYADSWDTIIMKNKYDALLKYKKMNDVASNLHATKLKITGAYRDTLMNELRCAINYLSLVNELEISETLKDYETLEEKVFITDDSIKVCYVKIKTKLYGWYAVVIGIYEGENLICYSYSDLISADVTLQRVEKKNKLYYIYGIQNSSYNDFYRGKFIVTIDGNTQQLQYEKYERVQ